MNIKIGVCFHKEYEINDYIKNKEIYIPIFGGRELYNGNSEFLLNMQGDNTGDNISYLNEKINEITAIYWMGTHLKELEDPDYIGFFHYRRFLKYNINDLNENIILGNRFDLGRLNVINHICIYDTSYEFFSFYINLYLLFNQNDKDLMIKFLNESYFYKCNMFIMHKKLFQKYFKFVKFNVELCKLILNFYQTDIFLIHPRSLGYIFERMTAFFIYKMKNEGYVINECDLLEECNNFKI